MQKTHHTRGGQACHVETSEGDSKKSVPAKLVVLGIDAASPLLETMAQEGRLPNISSVLGRSTFGHVNGVEALFVGSTWPSFYTGLNPGKHGFYRIEQLRSGSYTFCKPLASEGGVGGTPFWRLASNAGLRVAVLDVPLTRVEPHLNGIQIVEWGGHDEAVGFGTFPKHLAGQIVGRFGKHPHPESCDAVRSGTKAFGDFLGLLERGVETRTELAVDILEREDWDLFVQVFTEVHCVGHQCWHLHDPTHPAHDAETRRHLGDPLERVLIKVDRAVGTILQYAPEATVLLVSNHGMRHFYGANFLLPRILFRLGMAMPTQQVSSRRRGAYQDWGRNAWHKLPQCLRRTLSPLRARVGPPIDEGRRLGVDVDQSRCFPVPAGFPVSGIRLNLRGREPNGIVEPGPEASALCEELEAALLEIVDQRTGKPLVHRVVRTSELYGGPRSHMLPDLLVEWVADVPTGSTSHAGGRGSEIICESSRIGQLNGRNQYMRTRDHDPFGFFALSTKGQNFPRRSDAVSIYDFHPTICQLLGVEPPVVDGIPITGGA